MSESLEMEPNISSLAESHLQLGLKATGQNDDFNYVHFARSFLSETWSPHSRCFVNWYKPGKVRG